jgi:hypothetical protein
MLRPILAAHLFLAAASAFGQSPAGVVPLAAVALQPAPAPAFGMGLVPPDDLAQRQRLSVARHAQARAHAPKATEPEWDSRAKGWVPGIRNQGDCGSCWDFAAVGAGEVAAIKAGKGTAATTNWSEQHVLNCGRNGGCQGDWPETALEQIRGAGIADERDVPYTGRPTACNAKIARPNTIDDYGYVGPEMGAPSTAAIKDAIKLHGSVAVAVAADNAFIAYRGGIFTGTGSQGINHAVVLVGWKDEGTSGHWILRNTWGTGWGEAGYMRIRYGANLVGYGAMWASVDAAQPPAPPVPPVPPVPPGPAPTPGKGFTGSIATVQSYKDGVPQGPPVTVVGGLAGGDYDGGDLQAAGVTPALIADVLQLLRAVRARDRAAILAAVTKLLADLALTEPPAPTPVPQPMPARREPTHTSPQ